MNACPICGRDARPLFTLKNSPRLQNVLFDSAALALAAPKGDYAFEFCPRCIHGFNPGFRSDEVEYDSSYDNDQSASETYRRHVGWVVDHMVDRCALGTTSRVLEIGCGNGYLLSRLGEATGATIMGFDPAYNGSYGDPANFRKEYFRPVPHETWDLVILRHCLDSFTDPAPIVEAARQAVGTGGRLYVESADLEYILRSGDFSLFYHECARYFSKSSLATYLAGEGLVLDSATPSFGGQYFSCFFRAASDPAGIERIPAKLSQALGGSERVLVWGISGRAVTILSHLSLGIDRIAFAADIATAKQGRHVPVTGQRILSPADAVAYDPEIVLVCNENYAAEIQRCFPPSATRRFLGIDGESLPRNP